MNYYFTYEILHQVGGEELPDCSLLIFVYNRAITSLSIAATYYVWLSPSVRLMRDKPDLRYPHKKNISSAQRWDFVKSPNVKSTCPENICVVHEHVMLNIYTAS